MSCSDEYGSPVYGDLRQKAHQLLVIGNGFDLACNLRSNYSHFFGNLREKVYPPQLDAMSWGDYLKAQGLTVWDVIFCALSEDTHWFNVEADINRWVNSSRNIGQDPIQGVLYVLSRQDVGTLPKNGAPKRHYRYEGKPHDAEPETDVALYILDTRHRPVDGRWTRSVVLDILMDELHLLESRFGDYLEEQVRSTASYKQSALKLLADIREDGLDHKRFSYETTILNFNYTSPYGPAYNWNEDGMVSIHGHIGGEIIFGIDGEGCMSDSEARPFTKTYRVMGANADGVTRIAYAPGGDLGCATSLIKFFGHSLSDADYSYFQAIFDIVNLYDGDTELVFYYRPYGDEPDERIRDAKARNDMMRRVTKLLVAYGDTLDNRYHGRNLIHRLLLEGRLRVKQI